jgi:hypothetical protein
MIIIIITIIIRQKPSRNWQQAGTEDGDMFLRNVG